MEKKSEIKAVIFDVGGVLFTTNWENIRERIMRKYHFSIFLYSDYPKKIQNKFKGLPVGRISFKKAIKELSGRKDKKEIEKIIKDYKKYYLKSREINKELIKLIKKLKNKFYLFCLTDTNDLHFEANMEDGIFKNFKKVYASCKIKIKKPDRRAFSYILKKHNIKPHETIFIDDKSYNLKPAKKLGIKTILFKNNQQLIKNMKKLRVKI